MKKKFAVVLSVLLAVSMLAGCGKETSHYLKDIKVSKYLKFNEEYKGLPITIAAKEIITDEAVEELAVSAYNNSAAAQGGITDREVELGDTVNIDYSGKKDGVAFDGGTAENQLLTIGSGSFIDGFEDGLVGVMPGETVDLNLTFPDPYKRNPDLAGQEVVFTVTVNYICISSVEEMKDEVIATITQGEHDSVDAFIAFCRAYLESNAEYQYTVARENAVISALEGIVTCKKVPDSLVEKYAETITNSATNQAAQRGMDLDTFCQYYYQKDSASYIAQAAENSARQGMIFQYIANEEGLNISDEELDESLQRFVEENGLESVEALLAEADKEEFREYFMYEKVVDFILANAQLTEN